MKSFKGTRLFNDIQRLTRMKDEEVDALIRVTIADYKPKQDEDLGGRHRDMFYYVNVNNILDLAFVWRQSPQGHKFWERIYYEEME